MASSLGNKLEDYKVKGERIKVKVEGKKVKG
jgi:hypothetical protein